MLPWQLSQLFQSLEGLIVFVLPEQPQRTLVEPPSGSEEGRGWDDLHGHGNSPRRGAGLVHVFVDAVVDPEADEGAGLVRDFEETGKNTTDGGNGELGDVAGHGGSDGTASEASENTASI